MLSEDSIPGRVLHSLVGYTAQPSGLQLAAYAAVILVTLLFSRRAHRPAPAARPAQG